MNSKQKFAKCLDAVLDAIENGEIGNDGEAYIHLVFQMVAEFELQGSRPYVKEIHEALRIMKHLSI